MADLVDMDFHNRYNSNKDKTGKSCAVDTFEILDHQRVLTAHDDFILRVFDINGILHSFFVLLFFCILCAYKYITISLNNTLAYRFKICHIGEVFFL